MGKDWGANRQRRYISMGHGTAVGTIGSAASQTTIRSTTTSRTCLHSSSANFETWRPTFYEEEALAGCRDGWAETMRRSFARREFYACAGAMADVRGETKP